MSFKAEIATSVYAIEGKDAHHLLVMVNLVPEYPEDQRSLWSKLLGCYGVVVSVNKTYVEHSITQGVIELGCNNIEALQKQLIWITLSSQTIHILTSLLKFGTTSRSARSNGKPDTYKDTRMKTPSRNSIAGEN